MIISEVLDAIDNVNSITIESELDTCKSLLSSYDKMSLLEEYYEGDDINGFKIFQEAQTESPKKNQGIFRTIINAIKTLFKAIAQWFQNIFNPQKVKQAEDNVKKCKKLGKKERAAIFGALGLATVTVASAAAVHHHKKNDNDEDTEDNEKQPDSDKKTDEAVDDGDVKDDKQPKADETESNKQQNTKLKLGKTDEQLKKALEKSNKKCMEYHKRLEEAVKQFNEGVENNNPFANKKDEFGWNNRKKGSSEAKKYPCITYNSEIDRVCFTYNIDLLIKTIADLNSITKRYTKFFTSVIDSIKKKEPITDEYINKLYEKIDGHSKKINKNFRISYWATDTLISKSDPLYLFERGYSSDSDQIYDLEKLIEDFKQKIPVDEFNNSTKNYNDMLNEISNATIADVICKNERLLKEFRSLTSYYEKRKNIIEPFLGLLNEAINQYNLIINKIYNNKNSIDNMNYKMTNGTNSVRKTYDQKKLRDDMCDELRKFVNQNGKQLPTRKQILQKQKELGEQYKNKGLEIEYDKNGNPNYYKIFGDVDNYVEDDDQ